MKTGFLNVLCLLAFLMVFLTGPSALAVGSGAVPVRRVYSVSPISQYNYAQLIAQTVKGVKGVQVNNTGVHPIELAFGGSGGEVAQVLVGGAQDTGFLPMSGGYATRLSVIALDGPNETGELDVNIFYN